MPLSAKLIDTSSERMLQMKITHTVYGKEVTQSFPCSSAFLTRSANRTWDNLLKYLNEYWASLPVHEQDRIFEIYGMVMHGLDTHHDNDSRAQYMSDRISELYELHDLDRVDMFLRTSTDMVIPPDVPGVFVLDEDHNHNEQQTYLRIHYARLAALSTIFKSFIPIWGSYIDGCRKHTGNNFKEFEAFLLLRRTPLFTSDPIEKLKAYVERSCGDKGLSLPENVFKGITSEDCSFWLTSRICVRRVTGADIGGSEHLIRTLNRAVKQFTAEQSSPGGVVVKKAEPDTGDAERQPSIIEGVHRKSNISPGTKVELEVSMRDIPTLARSIMVSLDMNLLDNALQTVRVLENRIPVEPQLTLMRWVMCRPDVLSFEAPDYVGPYYISRLLAAAQAILWQNGHHNLAMLVTAETLSNSSEFMTSITSTRAQVIPTSIEKLAECYPYDKENRRANMAAVPDIMASIEKLAKDFSNYRWRATASDDLLLQAYESKSRTIIIQPTLKEQITRLVYEIGNGSWI